MLKGYDAREWRGYIAHCLLEWLKGGCATGALRAKRANVDEPRERVLQNAVLTPLWRSAPDLYFFERQGRHKMASVTVRNVPHLAETDAAQGSATGILRQTGVSNLPDLCWDTRVSVRLSCRLARGEPCQCGFCRRRGAARCNVRTTLCFSARYSILAERRTKLLGEHAGWEGPRAERGSQGQGAASGSAAAPQQSLLMLQENKASRPNRRSSMAEPRCCAQKVLAPCWPRSARVQPWCAAIYWSIREVAASQQQPAVHLCRYALITQWCASLVCSCPVARENRQKPVAEPVAKPVVPQLELRSIPGNCPVCTCHRFHYKSHGTTRKHATCYKWTYCMYSQALYVATATLCARTRVRTRGWTRGWTRVWTRSVGPVGYSPPRTRAAARTTPPAPRRNPTWNPTNTTSTCTRARSRPSRRSPTARARARRRNYAAHARAPPARTGTRAPSEPVSTPVHTPTLQHHTHPHHSPPFSHVLAEIDGEGRSAPTGYPTPPHFLRLHARCGPVWVQAEILAAKCRSRSAVRQDGGWSLRAKW